MLSDGVNTYSYDAEGNVISSSAGNQFSYDAFNEQIRDNGTGAGSEVVFDPWGKTVSLWEVNAINQLQGSFEINATAYWGSTPIESYLPGSASSHFRYRDWVGSLRLETDAQGNVSNSRVNLAFGDGAANLTGSRDGSFDGFAGYWDGSTGATNHAPFREYSNLAGRWQSPDPYDGSYHLGDPQSLNRYSYALNNPLSFTDPADKIFQALYGISSAVSSISSEVLAEMMVVATLGVLVPE
jgi:RHS repeat-associated protein